MKIPRLSPSLTSFGLLALALVASAGCGGGGSAWDEFEPRSATIADLSDRRFEFGWLPQGNPIDSDLGPMSIDFGPLDDDGQGDVSIFETDGGSASGSVDFDGPGLTLEIESISGDIDLEPGQAIDLSVTADVDDGRIRLRDDARGVEATSDNE